MIEDHKPESSETPPGSEMAAGLIHEPGTDGIERGDEPTAEDVRGILAEAVPMYAISEVALDEIADALRELGIEVRPIDEALVLGKTGDPRADRALGFITAARENGPIPSDATLAERDMLLHGTGILKDGRHVDPEDFYVQPNDQNEEGSLDPDFAEIEPVDGEESAADACRRLAGELGTIQRQRDFLVGQTNSLIQRLAASHVAAGLIDMAAAQGYVQKETMPINAVLAQIVQEKP